MATTYKLLFVLLACCVLVEVINGLKTLHSQEVKAALSPTVFGFVFCDSCLENIYTRNTIVIPNVTASIACENFQATNTTTELGVFTFQIPTDIANSPTKLATCSVKVTHDPLKVQGDLNTCNKLVEFSAGDGQLAASSVPHSSQDGWSFYGVGPFVYQPSQALPFCQKKDQSPSLGPVHGTAPPYGSSLAPLPAFQVAALPPLPFPIESALPPIPVESSTPPTVHPPSSPFPFHQAPPTVVDHKAQPLPAFAHPPSATPPTTATGSKVPPFQHGQSLPPLPSQFPNHAHPPTASAQSGITPQFPIPKADVPPSQHQASAPVAGKQETAFPPRSNHPIGHLQVPVASPTQQHRGRHQAPAPAVHEAVPPPQHISPTASPANAPAHQKALPPSTPANAPADHKALPSAPPPSIRRAPRSSHQPPPAFTFPSPPPSHINPPNPPQTHPSPPFIPRQVPPPPFHTSRPPFQAPSPPSHTNPRNPPPSHTNPRNPPLQHPNPPPSHTNPRNPPLQHPNPPPSHTNPRNPPLQHPNPPPSHTNPRNPPLQHPNPPPSHARPGNPVHPNHPPPSHVNHRTPPPSHLNHHSPPPLRHRNPPSPRQPPRV